MQGISRHHFWIRGALLIPVFVIGLLSTLAFAVNHSRLHDLLVQQLKTQVGLEVSALRLQLFPTASIEVSDLVVNDALNDEPSLRARHATLSIRLWSLMTKQVAVLTLKATEPHVTIRRDEDGHWHVPLVDSERPADRSHGQWSVTDVVIRDGTLRIVDPTRLKSEGIAVHHVQAVLHSDLSHSRANVMFRGATDDGGVLHLAGTLTLMESEPSKSSQRKEFNGTLHFQNWNLPYWLERTRQYAEPYETAPQRGKLSANIRLDFPEHGEGFNAFASDIRADTEWLTIHGDIVITDGGTEHPAYAMALSASPVNSQTLLAHIPASWVPDDIQAAVDDHKLAGTIEFQSIALRGRMDVPRVPDEWRVVANVVDASGRWGKTAFIRKLSGTALLDHKHAELMNLYGEVNGVQLMSDKLGIADLDLIPTLDAQLNAYGEVQQVVAVLKELTRGTHAHRAVNTITSATGHLRVAVHLAGSLGPTPSLEMIWAGMSLEQAGATLETGLSIGGINGTFETDSHVLALKHVSGVLQGIHFEAQGSIDIDSTTRVNNLRVAMLSDGTAIRNLLRSYLPAATGLDIEGAVRSTVLVSGTATGIHCHGMIDATQTELSMPSIVHKKKGVRGLIEWEGKLFDNTRILVDRVTLALSNGELRAAGEVDLTRIPKFRWHIQAGPLSLRELADSGINIPITDGIVHTSAAITGEGTNWKTWLPSGSFSIRRGRTALPGLVEPLSELHGRLRFTPEGVLLDNVSFRMGEADVKLTGTVEQWRSHPRARVMVESSQLNVSTLLPAKTDPDPTGTRLEDWIQSKEATIAFIVKQLRYEQLVLKTVSGEIRVNGRNATLNELRAETPKGMLAGRLEARFAPENRIDLAAHLSVDGIPAQHVLIARNDEKEHLQGDVSMDGVLHARIDPQLPLKTTLSTGRDGIVVKIRSGRLRQDPVLTKALKILNLPAVLFGHVDFDQDGIPFQSLSARITAVNGVLSSEDIVFDSPVIKVAGAGSANISDNGLDLALAVSPVASYSDLLAKIPLLGHLLVGDHSGFTTAVFQAKGSLLNPDVAYLPLASLARGVSGYPRLAIDVLTRVIKLPPTALASLAE